MAGFLRNDAFQQTRRKQPQIFGLISSIPDTLSIGYAIYVYCRT